MPLHFDSFLQSIGFGFHSLLIWLKYKKIRSLFVLALVAVLGLCIYQFKIRVWDERLIWENAIRKHQKAERNKKSGLYVALTFELSYFLKRLPPDERAVLERKFINAQAPSDILLYADLLYFSSFENPDVAGKMISILKDPQLSSLHFDMIRALSCFKTSNEDVLNRIYEVYDSLMSAESFGGKWIIPASARNLHLERSLEFNQRWLKNYENTTDRKLFYSLQSSISDAERLLEIYDKRIVPTYATPRIEKSPQVIP